MDKDKVKETNEEKLVINKEDLSDLVKSNIQEAKETITSEKKEPVVEEKKNDMDYKEKTIKLFQAVLRRDNEAIKALSEGTSTAGGYLVPTEFYADVIRIWKDYSAVQKAGITVIPMESNTLNIPTGTGGFTSYWVSEGSAGTVSDLTFGQTQLVLKKLMTLGIFTAELLADAGVGLYDYLVRSAAEAMAYEENKKVLTNSSASPFYGILYDSSVTTVTMGTGHTTFKDITYDDIHDLVDAIPSEAEDGAMFIFHKNIRTYLRKLKDNDGRYLLDPNMKQFDGFPYLTTSVMPSGEGAPSTPFVIFGNFKYALEGTKGDMVVESFNAGTITDSDGSTTRNAITEDLQILRVKERRAFGIGAGEAFAVLKTAAS